LRPDDKTRVAHILDAADRIARLTDGLSFEEFAGSDAVSLAVIRLIEIGGEAANGITAEFRAAHPEVPWVAMVAMRNRLVHAYFDVDLRLVWRTARDELPRVAETLRRLSR
jgi:uncharacterized protein with HEPN domain